MIDALVVDASAFVAVMLDEPDGDAISERLSGARIIVPALAYFEVANVLAMKLRRRPENRPAYFAACEQFARVAVEIGDMDYLSTISLGQRRSLTAYDASYAWLALSRGVELVTLDKRLFAAFEAERGAAARQ